MEWMTLPLKRYAEFSGRSRRKEYWMFTLLLIIVNIVITVVETTLGLGGSVGGLYGPLSLLFMLAIIVPSIAVGVRRLHDTNRSGWWMLIGLLPIVGGIVLLIFFVLEGTSGSNEYGPDPKEAGAGGAYAA
ncbi:MAG TPA: DUF805 domain-containing protein [Allosphingosinicella sp.]|jgi:uncharacterized membrane protein YhaH (DUF805 family)